MITDVIIDREKYLVAGMLIKLLSFQLQRKDMLLYFQCYMKVDQVIYLQIFNNNQI